MLVLYFYANESVIGCMVELLVSHYLVATYTPSHPLLGHTLAYFLTIAYTTHYICDVMLGGGLYVSG